MLKGYAVNQKRLEDLEKTISHGIKEGLIKIIRLTLIAS